GENWLALIGRGEGIDAKARIMNLDIGGGTKEVANVEYQDHPLCPGADLTAPLLFLGSSTIARGLMVRRMIEGVLLPALAVKLSADPKKKEKFVQLMSAEKKKERNSWNRITRQVFIPIVRWWLTDLAADRYEAVSLVNMVGAEGFV